MAIGRKHLETRKRWSSVKVNLTVLDTICFLNGRGGSLGNVICQVKSVEFENFCV